MPDIGPHLLGRVPSPPDPRDYKLSAFLAPRRQASKLQTLNDAVQHSITTSRAVKAWASEVTALLYGSPAPPPPTPAAKQWEDLHQLDQGTTGHFAGFA